MTTAQPYIGNRVRQITRDDGVWTVLADACGVLGLDETTAVDLLEPGDLDSEGVYVSEAGALVLIVHSAKPAARAFRRRVLAELLGDD